MQHADSVVDGKVGVQNWLELAVQFHQTGKVEEAERAYRVVLDVCPTQVAAMNNLGVILRDRGDLINAEDYFRKVIHQEPAHFGAWNNLGLVLEARGINLEAEICYRTVLRNNPHHLQSLNNLGNLFKTSGDMSKAIRCYEFALKLGPNQTAIWGNLGNCLLDAGRVDDAKTAFLRGLELNANHTDLYVGAGRTAQAEGQLDDAAQWYQAAIFNDSKSLTALNNLGVVRLEQNLVMDALDHFSKVLEINPADWEARFNYDFSLPILYQSVNEQRFFRARFVTHLERLVRETSGATVTPELLTAVTRHSTFYLQYQGENDRKVQERYGELIGKVVDATMPAFVAKRPRRQKIRIAYISSHFRDHTVGRLTQGFITERNSKRFEAYLYYSGVVEQTLTQRLRATSDKFTSLSLHLEALVTAIRKDAPDVAVFTDLGMEPVLSAVAAARVAPVQCVFWGHPVTSGLPSVDYYISNQRMEPAQCDLHYSEQLVRLPGNGIYYERPEIPLHHYKRADFGLNDDDFVILSCQSLYKYLPEFDSLYARVAEQVKNCRFVFLAHPKATTITHQFEERLGKAFAQRGLNFSKFCCVLPHLSREAYLALNALSDLFMDTPGWSGGNTTLEALACNLPVVTLPGKLMRSRHAFGFLKALELETCIASSPDDYVQRIVTLAYDPAGRQVVSRHIREQADHQIFSQRPVIDAYEEWLEHVILPPY